MRRSTFPSLLLLIAVPFSARTADITTVAELDRVVFVEKATNRTFHLTATATAVCNPPTRRMLYLEDNSGGTAIFLGRVPVATFVNIGEVVEVEGITADDGKIHALCRNLTKLGRGNLKTPPVVTASDIQSGRFSRKRIRVEGVVRDAFTDEIDPNMFFLVIGDATGIHYAMLDTRITDVSSLQAIIGRKIAASGVSDSCSSPRPGMGHLVSVYSLADIEQLDSGQESPFDAPLLDRITPFPLDKFSNYGRHRTSGRVIAVWNDNHLLLERPSASPVRIELASGEALPTCGDFIEVAGLPETDLFKLNLSHAVYRKLPRPRDISRPNAIPMTIAQLTCDAAGRRKINLKCDGSIVTVKGRVVNTASESSEYQFYLSDGGLLLRIDVSAFPDMLKGIEPGYEICVSGTFILLTENWHSTISFPHISGGLLIPWSASDIKVLRRPSWWTPMRLLYVIGILLLLIVAIATWNIALRRLATLRGQELADKTIAQAESELKVYERTRLATELHDSLAQILTGVAFKLETADRLAETNPTAMRQHLGIAIRSLQACRDDLRNCLWDLRNHALEIPDMDKAIRRTLEQHLEGTALVIRFNVPRERLSDNTTHEILCIIRELVLNAIRHGHATEVRVAGAIEDEMLRFSVSDNGCGFDPDNCPGMREGHYGLQGVRERAAHLDGEFTIRANGTSGMKAVVSIKIPHTT